MIQHIYHDKAWREFHVARTSRDHYQFDQALFATDGNVILADFQAARIFAQRMNEKRDLANSPEQAVRASHINAMGMIDEILHYVVARYREEENPQVLGKALAWLEERLGNPAIDTMLQQFVDEFPPIAVYRGEQDGKTYLSAQTAGVSNRQLALEELVLLWINNMNPALEPFAELFDDAQLEKLSAYLPAINELRAFFDTQPFFGPDNQNLIDMLRAPALAEPGSLMAQLRYILSRWSYISEPFFRRLLISLDFIKEEEKPVFFGPGPALVPTYTRGRSTVGLDEPERFSPDKDWMPNAVLMAKNTYVWLDQLSRKYERSIRRLDEIPDEELDSLARRGFTGLWLIGLWERSVASKRIKQMCGNPDAVASAYSLYDYVIAHDLGGPDAMNSLRERGWQRGLRMASDMVPNHMAIDSRWVVEHPDWFIALDHSPFPTYTFSGVNLAPDERVGIYLEDHYYSRSDAAVVFKRVDHWTGSEKYIYHGNDGTSMPWNDTAQLNYLDPTVREAVIQTILHVARQFPIIRFDAAMTLAKRHYQRLWFPEPGTGGSIPSRAEHGLTAEQFNHAIPEEFWREVVDRVAQEVPETLLLAEAFWMMEGYFVRTLGMHRVYNSAFMNMLRDEENSNYRTVLKNTLEFDPDILKRYVNFMNNPDEDTAVDQFGKGDKYFGICTLMATLPGLPMFGHGQIEGFAEKYGMEYQRAYWNEQVDEYLVERHEREIFPLLRQRYVFAEVQDFLLYDFWTPDGHVNEDVFAYSNRWGDERALVVYHNKYADASGWIRTSVGAARKTGNGSKEIVQKVLGDGLGINTGAGRFTIFRDSVRGLEYIRSSQELCEKGLLVELKAYEAHVFLDFREVQDNEARHYEQVATRLNGRGVPSLDIALLELILQPLHEQFRQVTNPNILRHLATQAIANLKPGTTKTLIASHKPVLDDMQENAVVLLQTINQFTGHNGDAEPIAQAMRDCITTVLGLPELAQGKAGVYLRSKLDTIDTWLTLLSWAVVQDIGKLAGADNYQEQSRTWLDELLLAHVLTSILLEAGLDAQQANSAVYKIKMLTVYADLFVTNEQATVNKKLVEVFHSNDAPQVLGVNQFKGTTWFNQEAFERTLWYLFVTSLLNTKEAPTTGTQDKTLATYNMILELQQQAEAAGYQVEKFLKVLQPEAPEPESEVTESEVTAANGNAAQESALVESDSEVTL